MTMDRKATRTGQDADLPVATDRRKARYRKPELQRFGPIADHTGGFSNPVGESGNTQNRNPFGN